jgi:hypothetical protein
MDKIMETSLADAAQVTVSDGETLADSGFFRRELNGLKVLVCRSLEQHGFINGFSTRSGGVSPFPSNDLNLAGFDDEFRCVRAVIGL